MTCTINAQDRAIEALRYVRFFLMSAMWQAICGWHCRQIRDADATRVRVGSHELIHTLLRAAEQVQQQSK